MITVKIYINDEEILKTSAYQIEVLDGDQRKYLMDNNRVVKHHRNRGAIVLAKKMLDRVTLPSESERRLLKLIDVLNSKKE